ncbi:MAG: hypothetical protein LBQ20_09420 [Rhodanobacter sp.]|jgi:hypothetical protein|nr:hypothetical protein [Rhodanobacter sp.]
MSTLAGGGGVLDVLGLIRTDAPTDPLKATVPISKKTATNSFDDFISNSPQGQGYKQHWYKQRCRRNQSYCNLMQKKLLASLETVSISVLYPSVLYNTL